MACYEEWEVVTMAKKEKMCPNCRGRIAVVYNVLCQECFDAYVADLREELEKSGPPISETDLRDLVLSFFVGW